MHAHAAICGQRKSEDKKSIMAAESTEFIALEKQIEVCLEAFEGLELGSNLDFFKGNVRKYLKASYHSFKPPSDPLKVMLNIGISCGSIFKDESRFWLTRIFTRLAMKVSIRDPYHSQILRNIPLEVFLSLKRAVDHTRNGEVAGNVISEENRKCHVLAFTSERAVTSLFSMLSGLSVAEVQSHFKRKLTGRLNGRAAVIINAEKEFSLVYKVNLNQCMIEFYYGVWNSAGFPLHH